MRFIVAMSNFANHNIVLLSFYCNLYRYLVKNQYLLLLNNSLISDIRTFISGTN